MKKLLLLIVSVLLIFSHLSGIDIKDDNYMKHFLGGIAIPEATWQVSSLFFDKTVLLERWDEDGYHCEIIRVEKQQHFPYKILISMGVTTAIAFALGEEGKDLYSMGDGFQMWFVMRLMVFQIKRARWW